MNDIINNVDIWKGLIILLLLLHCGMYSQLFIASDKVKIRNRIKENYDLSKPFQILYWVTTIGAIVLTIGISIVFLWKVILWVF